MRRVDLSDILWANVEEQEGIELVAVHGEIDLSNVNALVTLVLKTVGSTIIVDLAGVTFIGAAGVRALERLRADVELQGHRVVYAGASVNVKRVFAILRLTHLLD